MWQCEGGGFYFNITIVQLCHICEDIPFIPKFGCSIFVEKDHLKWLLPEPIIGRFFKEMCNVQKDRREQKNPLPMEKVGKVAFFVSMSIVFKQTREEKAHTFYSMSAEVDQVVTSLEVENLCKTLLNAYVTALQKTSTGNIWKLQTTEDANQRFAKCSIRDLLGQKTDPSCVSLGELTVWFSKFPLIEKLFLAVMRAGFLDVESLVEEKPHGLQEGCEETVAHVQYDRYTLFPLTSTVHQKQ